MQSMQSQLERERQRRILEDRRAKDELRAAEEQERERLRAEKRAAKVSPRGWPGILSRQYVQEP